MPYKSPLYQFTLIDDGQRHEAMMELPGDGEAERVARELLIGHLMGLVKRDQASEVIVEVKRIIWSSEEVRERVLVVGSTNG